MKLAPLIAAVVVLCLALPGAIDAKKKPKPQKPPKSCIGKDKQSYEIGQGYLDTKTCIQYTCVKKGKKVKMVEKKMPRPCSENTPTTPSIGATTSTAPPIVTTKPGATCTTSFTNILVVAKKGKKTYKFKCDFIMVYTNKAVVIYKSSVKCKPPKGQKGLKAKVILKGDDELQFDTIVSISPFAITAATVKGSKCNEEPTTKEPVTELPAGSGVEAMERKIEALQDSVQNMTKIINAMQSTLNIHEISITTNKESIKTNNGSIATNRMDIYTHGNAISKNIDGIRTNEEAILRNKDDLSTQQDAISKNNNTCSAVKITAHNLGTCLADVTSKDCPSSAKGKTSITDAIIENKEEMEAYGSCCGVSTTSMTSTTKAPGNCTGLTHEMDGCCTSENPCGVGHGDCDYDYECAGNLICIDNNNCRDFDPQAQGNADCCIEPVSTVSTTSTTSTTKAPGNCTGLTHEMDGCCTSENPCGVGHGDCDYDYECAGNLICIDNNNCRDFDPQAQGNADCCIEPVSTVSTTSTTSTTKAPGTTSTCKCGIKKKGTRIVNGTDVEEFEWPWIARLSVRYDSGSYQCGGSLIADQWILTAAHCTIQENGKLPQVTVYLGDHHKSFFVTDTNEIVLQVEKIINHASYSSRPPLNDISLLKLSNKVDMTKYTPACLPKAGSTYVGNMADVYGWGTTSFGGSTSDILQETSVEVITNQACTDQGYGSITEKQICAYTEGTDSCQGDSGGPLTYNDNDKHKQIGVVSYGNGCATAGFSGVYSRVTEYLDWITTETGKYGGATYCDE